MIDQINQPLRNHCQVFYVYYREDVYDFNNTDLNQMRAHEGQSCDQPSFNLSTRVIMIMTNRHVYHLGRPIEFSKFEFERS